MSEAQQLSQRGHSGRPYLYRESQSRARTLQTLPTPLLRQVAAALSATPGAVRFEGVDLQAGILLARRALLPRPLQGHVQVRLKSVLAESRRATEGLALGTRCLRINADAHATHSST